MACLGEFIPRYFILLVVMVNGIVSLTGHVDMAGKERMGRIGRLSLT